MICGGRKWFEEGNTQEQAEQFILECLSSLPNPPQKEDVVFITGVARGADQIPITLYQREMEWKGVEYYHAEWKKYGSRAGPIRNQRMLDEGKPDLVIAFPDSKSRGTYHMIKISEEAGVPVRIYEPSFN